MCALFFINYIFQALVSPILKNKTKNGGSFNEQLKFIIGTITKKVTISFIPKVRDSEKFCKKKNILFTAGRKRIDLDSISILISIILQ